MFFYQNLINKFFYQTDAIYLWEHAILSLEFERFESSDVELVKKKVKKWKSEEMKKLTLIVLFCLFVCLHAHISIELDENDYPQIADFLQTFAHGPIHPYEHSCFIRNLKKFGGSVIQMLCLMQVLFQIYYQRNYLQHPSQRFIKHQKQVWIFVLIIWQIWPNSTSVLKMNLAVWITYVGGVAIPTARTVI